MGFGSLFSNKEGDAMKKMLFWLLFLFATVGFSSAKIVMAQGDCVRIDLSDTTAVIEKHHEFVWKYGINTKPYIPWTIEAGDGKGCVNFGDLRLFEQTGQRVFLYLSIQQGDKKSGIIFLSQMNEGYIISHFREKKIDVGFSLFEPKATEFILKGLEPGSVIMLAVLAVKKGRFVSAVSMGLTHCLGQFSPTNPICSGTDLKLKVLEYRKYILFGKEDTWKEKPKTVIDIEEEDLEPFRLWSPTLGGGSG